MGLQAIDSPLTRTSIFLVLCVEDKPGSDATVRSVLGSLGDLLKNVAVRDLDGATTCTVGVSSRVWARIFGDAHPSELKPFTPVRGAKHSAPSTPGDLLFHIRSARRDVAFELERQLVELLRDATTVVDETVGFRYFDARDLLGFVDGTANPVGPALPESTLVGAEDERWAGGSYVVVQKYVHDLQAWRKLTTEAQERIVGRQKLDNIELPDALEGQKSHKTLCTITDAAGEHDILRDNMPFGSPAQGEFGTYFIGYSRRLWVIEKMLERMFVGAPPGLHDQILDFSTPLTGTVFFAPSASQLEALS